MGKIITLKLVTEILNKLISGYSLYVPTQI